MPASSSKSSTAFCTTPPLRDGRRLLLGSWWVSWSPCWLGQSESCLTSFGTLRRVRTSITWEPTSTSTASAMRTSFGATLWITSYTVRSTGWSVGQLILQRLTSLPQTSPVITGTAMIPLLPTHLCQRMGQLILLPLFWDSLAPLALSNRSSHRDYDKFDYISILPFFLTYLQITLV